MINISVPAYTKEEVQSIVSSVRRRDGDRCLVHGTLGSEVHELLQKSSGRKRSKEVFQLKYMACVCNECHTDIHHRGKKKETNAKLLSIMKSRYGYKYNTKEDKELLGRILTPTLQERRKSFA